MKRNKACLFCNIINNKIESAPIWSNDFCTAVLDLFPNVYGQTILITNKHYPSNIFDVMVSDAYQTFFASACKVIDLLKKRLQVKRVALVVEGLGVDHAHIKLYPLHGLQKTFQEMWHPEIVYFEKYEGYISTQRGPQADINELKRLAKKISE